MRARAKTINFATIYGQGAHALSRQLKIAHAEAKEFIEKYFQRFSARSRIPRLDGRVRASSTAMCKRSSTAAGTSTSFATATSISARSARRTAANSPIQGSAADLIKIAMIRIHASLAAHRLNARMLLQVHDELVFEVPGPELEQVSALVQFEMEHAADLSVPLVVDLGSGDNWLATKMDG